MCEYKKLDDFVLVHYSNRYNWKKILETGELRSSYYIGKLEGVEYDLGLTAKEWGMDTGGNPTKIYTLLYKKSKLKDLLDDYLYKYNPVFYFDPRLILDYRDKVSFSPYANFGVDGYPYKRFPKTPYTEFEGFEELWPKNDEEELALNLHHFWDMFEEQWKNSDGDNELMFETDFVPISKYLIKVEP